MAWDHVFSLSFLLFWSPGDNEDNQRNSPRERPGVEEGTKQGRE